MGNYFAGMKSYVVLYRVESIMSPLDAPFGFQCWAEDGDHAEDQCIDAYPDCDVVWLVETDNYQYALEDYYFLNDAQRTV